MRFISMCVDVIVVGVRACVRAYEQCRQHRSTEISNKRDGKKRETRSRKELYYEFERIKWHAERQRRNKVKRKSNKKIYKKKRKFQVAALNRMGMHMTSGEHAIVFEINTLTYVRSVCKL